MTRKTREFYKGGFWHIFNRGVAQQNIFQESADFRFYLYRIKESLKKFPLAIHAYNLLNNHIHYLMEQTLKDMPPNKFISSIHTSFANFINRKYNRVGHLFQDRFRANHIKENEDILAISFYIHLNKVLERLEQMKKKTITDMELDKLLDEAAKDPWNSFGVYLGLRKDEIIQPDFILSILSDDIKKARTEYKKMARDFIVSGHFLKTRDLIFEQRRGQS